MLGENIMDYIHPKDRQKFCQQFMGVPPDGPKKRRNLGKGRCGKDEGISSAYTILVGNLS